MRFTGTSDNEVFYNEICTGSLTKKASTLSIPLASLKLPPITSISYSSVRAKDWDDILTAHSDETFARSWTMLGKRMGKHSLGFAGDVAKGKDKANIPVGSVKVGPVLFDLHYRYRCLMGLMGFASFQQAVCVTACGNFGIASSSTGAIYMWNMQSGIKRKSFDVGPCPPELAHRFRHSGKKGGGRCVTGLASDALNRSVIASTLDGTINVRSILVRSS